MTAGPDIALTAGLIGDRARAAMMSALLGGEALPASVLAARAGVTPQTASAHLAKLAAAGLVKMIRRGRYRLYCLSGPKIADALEALAAISPERAVRSLHQADESAAIRLARMCYDHLAGYIGVGVAEALVRRSLIAPRGREFRITKSGTAWLREFGIDPDSLRESRRILATQCLDWSERRPHVGGALGTALADRMIALGWIARSRLNRSVRISADGRRSLLHQFRISSVAVLGGRTDL
jgi:DNA-binding transcriptional ArsR family regulator